MVHLLRYFLVLSVLCVAGFGAVALHAQQPALVAGGLQASDQPEPLDEFVPIDQLPPQDQLPAAPLLISAYAFVVLALFVYVLSVARRLGQVQQELTRLESEIARGRRT